jgi:DNA-binding response OmpR family regulator
MDSILVISEEPALAETLSSELSAVSIEQARPQEASAKLRKGDYRLVLFDSAGEADDLPETGAAAVLRLSRPIVLRDLLYTIGERLQGKTAGGREEMPLAEGLRFSPAERLVRPDSGAPIALTEKETELLSCLMEARGSAIARDTLLKRIWGYSDDIATHTLETHIYRLRGKLKAASEKLDILSSDEGGYRLKL